MAVSDRPVMIKKVKKVFSDAHHGGAWKVAYSDFVTAMMAFFLLMWLINTTSPEQKRGIADYFAPAGVSETTSGSGGILAGTALGDDGAKSKGSSTVVEQMAPKSPNPDDGKSAEASKITDASADSKRQALMQRDDQNFASAAQS